MIRNYLLLFMCVCLLAACGHGKAYESMFKDEGGNYQKAFDEPLDTVCTAIERAVLGQGFCVEKYDRENHALVCSRVFKEGDRTVTFVLSATARSAQGKTIVYATANEVAEELHTSRNFDWFLIIPRPTGKTAVNVKAGGATVDDPKFYDRFFEAVRREIERGKGTGS